MTSNPEISTHLPLAGSQKPGVLVIVDDEPMVTSSIKTMLVLETEYQIYTFNNPVVALAEIAAIAPDVVISDFLMPEMDGIAFLKQVKTLLPETTLILLTGYADKNSAIEAINSVGIYRYVQKPWDNDELKLNIQNGMERAHLLGNLHATIHQLTEAQDQLQTYNHHLEELVTERTRDLQVTYQTLQSIVQNTADGMMTLDEHRRVASINPTVEKLLQGRKAQGVPVSVVGKPVESILSLPDRGSLADSFNPSQSTLVKEALIGRSPVEVSISPVPETGGFVLVLRDIAQRKEIERLRDDFMSTLTHDLRTPLLAAIQTLGFFADGSLGQLSPKQKEILTMLVQSNREMLGLVNVLLEVYKYESGRQRLVFDTVDVQGLLEAICQELEAMARHKEQTLELDLSEAIPKIYGDKQELRRVFVNLIGNALNYTPRGGHVRVTAQSDGTRLTVAVEDNGRGIPASDIPQLFQRFSQGTSKQRSSGTGLGLYLSRQIVEAHQGTIGVESTEGVGSRFYLSLPKTQAATVLPVIPISTAPD
jgi:signal transduction histidine kinase